MMLTTYQQLGVQAAQEAARLEPGDIGPHYELAMLYAAALPQNPPPEALQLVLDEIQIMYELNPAEAQALEPNVYDILEWVVYNDATATAEAAGRPDLDATETVVAAVMQTPLAMPLSTATPQPLSIATAGLPAGITGYEEDLVVVVAVVVGIIIAGYLVLIRMRGSPDRNK